MKKLLYTFLTLALSTVFLSASLETQAQDDKSKRPSPPETVSQQVKGAQIVVEYSRPSVKDRKVFGELVPFDKVWRTGANEATTFSTDKALKIEGQTLAAGKYGLFTIPGEKEWVIIFNKTPQQWGAYKYKSEDDVLRVKAKPQATKEKAEKFTITVSEKGLVTLHWDYTKVAFTVAP